MTFTIKNVRDTAGGAYSFSLYEDGERVAVITNDGRGGPDNIEPVLTEGKVWRDEVARLEATLTAWAEAVVPEWYLTDHGNYPRLTPSWELALGYLSESAEYDRMARTAGPGRYLLRLPDGRMGYGLPNHPSNRAALRWEAGDWIPAA
jgi:hypothetical protein